MSNNNQHDTIPSENTVVVDEATGPDSPPASETTATAGEQAQPQAQTEDGTTEGPPNGLEVELAEARRQADEYLDQWRRTTAEFQNYRRRQDRERQELIRGASARLIERLLPVIDDLQRAAQHLPAELRDNEWVNGVLMVEKKLLNLLESEGVRPINATPGAEFDPAIHDALLSEESDQYTAGQIVQELEPGYTLNDKMLRAAKVKVAR